MAEAAEAHVEAAEAFGARLDAVIGRVRDMAHLRSTGPAMRNHLQEVVQELVCLRRDLGGLGDQPLASVTHVGAWTARSAKEGDRRVTKGREKFPNDRAGQRFCPTHHDGTGAWLAIALFDLKDDKGHRKARCHECILEYQRQRYVRVGYKVVTVEVAEGDACLGHACPKCGGKFAVGDRVQGDNLAHEKCRP